jgi:hydrogenase maturation protein HypF
MENYETLKSFQDGIEHFERLFRVRPEAIAYDLHPNYLATRYALERSQRESIPVVGVQHHHAHIAACMVEHGIKGEHPMIGVSFDGTGYGDDGRIWGGEFLFVDYSKYQRFAHLTYVPLPGGDKAIQEPWRIALSWLHHLGFEWEDDLFPVIHATHNIPTNMEISALDVFRRQVNKEINTPLTSSMGRLFDAISSLLGVRQEINYEAQAAMELEAIVDPNETGSYPFILDQNHESTQVSININPSPTFSAILNDLHNDISKPVISARFHNGLSIMVTNVCLRMRKEFDTNEVVLSGGVWQNTTLLSLTLSRLSKEGFKLYIHSKVPSNDGGLALGQAAIGTQTIADHG